MSRVFAARKYCLVELEGVRERMAMENEKYLRSSRVELERKSVSEKRNISTKDRFSIHPSLFQTLSPLDRGSSASC